MSGIPSGYQAGQAEAAAARFVRVVGSHLGLFLLTEPVVRVRLAPRLRFRPATRLLKERRGPTARYRSDSQPTRARMPVPSSIGSYAMPPCRAMV